VDSVDIGDLQADAVPAEYLTNWGDVAAWAFLPTMGSSSSTYRWRPSSRKHEVRAQRLWSQVI
jgi:hypothetical protein